MNSEQYTTMNEAPCTPIINNADLETQVYPEHVLEANIDRLCLRQILYYQKVSPDFCYKYFWDPDDKYMKDDCDHRDNDDVFQHEILFFQPHITLEALHNCDEYWRRINKSRADAQNAMAQDAKANVEASPVEDKHCDSRIGTPTSSTAEEE